MIVYRLSKGSPEITDTPRGAVGSWLPRSYPRRCISCLDCRRRRLPIVGSHFCNYWCSAIVINLQKLKETLYETNPSDD
jgi:hypothetical protein